MENLKLITGIILLIGFFLLCLDSEPIAISLKPPSDFSTLISTSMDTKDILINEFIKEADKRNIEVEGEGYLKEYKEYFESSAVIDMIKALTLIPEEHLEVVKVISFQRLEYHCAKYDCDKDMIIVACPGGKEIIHETGHLVYHDLKENLEKMKFQGDYDFLCKFYYEEAGRKPPKKEELDPEEMKKETFAVMYHMYMAEPERLEKWIEKRVKEDEKLAFNNYQFMKKVVFPDEKY